MAKRRRGQSVGGGQMAPSGPEAGSGAVGSAVVGFAEDLGRILGAAQARAEDWLNQRKAVTEQLTQIRDAASQYLQQLVGAGANITEIARRRRRGRPVGSKNKRGPGRPAGARKKRRTMSPEARAKIAAAQRARWAKQKKAKGSKYT